MNAVIYARYSSERQTEQSIDGQIRECREFAKHNKIKIIGTYIDRGISGKTDHRPDFQRMIKDAEKNQFEAVIVYKLDRFARNRYDSAIYKSKLKKHGVKVLSAKENITDAPEGIILESLLEGMAEYYSAELSQKIQRGMKENALKCKTTGGNILLGYKIAADKTFEVDPLTAPVVQKIFEMYDQDYKLIEIARTLNEMGYRTSRNVPFNKGSFHTILKNKKYIGIYDHAGVTIEDGVPAIIDKELFERVQIKMEKTKKAPGAYKSNVEYLLSTKIFCGLCGANMVGESGAGRSKNYHYYKCVTRKRLKTCEKKNIKKEWIEDLVVNITIKEVLKDKIIEFIADRIIRLLDEEKNYPVIKAIEARIKETDKSIKNLMNAIEQGIITDSTKNRLLELESMKEDLEIQLAQEQIVKPTLTKEQIVYWLNQFKKGDVRDPEYRKRIIDVFVNAVFVYEDKIIITYNYSGNNNQITVGSDMMNMVEVIQSYPNLFIINNVFGVITYL